MLAKTLPLLLLGACASTAQLPTADQPELAQMAQPYVQQLQAVGITRVISPGSRAMVRLETSYGSVYVRYPAVAEPSAFVLDIGPDGLQAAAATFDRVRDSQILAALVPGRADDGHQQQVRVAARKSLALTLSTSKSRRA